MYVGGQPCTDDKDAWRRSRDLLIGGQAQLDRHELRHGRELRQGRLPANAGWNGAAFRARLQNPAIKFGFPRKASRSGWTMSPSSPTRKNVENAKLFLNFIMAPENAAMLSAFARYANGIKGSEQFMPADMQGAPELTLPERQQGRVHRDLPARGQRDDDPDLDRTAEVSADLVVTNARVLTMDAGAAARRGRGRARQPHPRRRQPGRGPWPLRGPGTRVIDAAGASVLPGFIESPPARLPGRRLAQPLAARRRAGHRPADPGRARLGGGPPRRPDSSTRVRPPTSCSASRSPATISTASCPTGRSPSTPSTATPSGPTPGRSSSPACCTAAPLLPGNEIVMGADGLATGELREPQAYAPLMSLPALRRAREAGRHHRAATPSRRPPPPSARARPRHHRRRACAGAPAWHHLDPQHGRQPLPAGPAGASWTTRASSAAGPPAVPPQERHDASPTCARSRRPCARAPAPTG